MLNIVLITSNELRHDYFRLSLCNNKKFKVLYSIIEENDNSKQYVENNNNDNLPYIRMNLSGSNIHSNLNIYNGDDNLSHYLNILSVYLLF